MSESNPNVRIEAFSDGVFAIAMTLLILDIKLPGPDAIRSTAEFWSALGHLLPSILAFLLSFTIIFITWVNHHAAFQMVEGSSTASMYANGFLLLTVVILPFPTALMGEYVLTDHAAPAVILYGAVEVLQGIAWIWLGTAAIKHKLTKNEQAERNLRKSVRYGYNGLAVYLTCTVLAIWFPLAVAIVMVLIWSAWVVVGVRLKNA